MPQLVTMPKLGLTMTQGTITAWMKREGDAVAAGETLCEIETDKITSPVESPAAGVMLKLLAQEFEEREIAAPLCVIGRPGDRWEDALAASREPETGVPEAVLARESQPVAQPQQAQPGKRVLISPVARRLAEEHGLDYSAATGSGEGGRIEKKDVERLLEHRGGRPAATAAAAGEPAVIRRVALAGARKVAAERLAMSKREIPHVYFHIDVDATALLAYKERAKAAGIKATGNDAIVLAAARALAEFPEVNASLIGDEILCYGDVNVGIAVSTDRGLYVPVLRQADKMALERIASGSAALIARAREGKATLDDLTGGTFTVSNLGAFGIDGFSAVINPPQVAILAVGRIAEKPVAIGGGVFVRPMVALTLSVDHRAIDGALAARFLQRLKEILETVA